MTYSESYIHPVVLLLAGAAAWWASAYGLSVAAEAPARFFWGDTKYLGIVSVPAAWLAFALSYTGRGNG